MTVFSGIACLKKVWSVMRMRRDFNLAFYWFIYFISLNPDAHQDTKHLFLINPFYFLGGDNEKQFRC
jgi:hypothetical protein